MNRRDFMKAAAMSAVATGLPHLTRAAEVSDGVCLHAFSKPLGWLDYDALADALVQAGYNGIDLSVRPQGHVEPERVEQELPRAVEAARKRNLRLDMIVTALTSADEPHAERILKTAAQCGVKIYRMGYLRYDFALGVEQTLEKMRGRMAALAALNERCGITGDYQNHHAWDGGLIGGSIWDIHHMLKGLDPRWTGCQYDIRHAVAEAGGSWGVGLRLIAPYIHSVCLKDFLWAKRKDGRWNPDSVFGGDGMVPWNQYFKLVKELGINVPSTVHCEWTLFTKEEEALPDAERRAIAVAKMKRDADFFRAQYIKHGIKA